MAGYDNFEEEREVHRELVFRNLEFLVDTLATVQIEKGWKPTTGCPTATDEFVARKRKDGNSTFPCLYESLSFSIDKGTHIRETSSSNCECGDPLSGFSNPMDSIAAVSIGTSGQRVSHRYKDWKWRRVIQQLHNKFGDWNAIYEYREQDLKQEISFDSAFSVNPKRIGRLCELLDDVNESSVADGFNLENIAPRPYNSLHTELSSYSGINRDDSWWLLLTAFDKPIWPSDPLIDGLLTDLGILHPEALEEPPQRRKELEDALPDRVIPLFHRALGGFAARDIHNLKDFQALQKFSLHYRLKQQENFDSKGPKTIDVFSGAGGISHGLRRSGFDIKLAIDKDTEAIDTYRLNHPEIPHSHAINGDIEDLLTSQNFPKVDEDDVDLVVGGPPCQSLSQAGYRARLAKDEDYSILDDPRTGLLARYHDVVDKIEPRAFILENVEGISNEIGDSSHTVLEPLIDALENAGDEQYTVQYREINTADFGIPQTRSRVIVVGVRKDVANRSKKPENLFELLEDETYTGNERTLRAGLAGLPRLRWGEGGNVYLGQKRGKLGDYIDEFDLSSASSVVFNHRARAHPMEKDRMLFRIMDPGDTGWEVKYKKDGGKWSDLIDYNVGSEDNPAFKDKYRMISWSDPAPTVVAHLAKDANNFIIPDYYEYVADDEEKMDPARNRGITPREAARLQSFPDDYIFLGSFTSQFRQIGNAVPPAFTETLGKVLRESGIFARELNNPQFKQDNRRSAYSDD